ncbi:MAG: MATE family efflux transporter [Oscillospiraceae bacterium]|nr:MATE family efflux transporter [Oscillospiraceae bacterium]
MNQTLNMTQGSPLRLLFRFALPLMFGNIFQQLYTVVDTAIVGQGVGMDALAALGGVDWLNWMMLGIIQGFTQGFCVRIAQKFGEGDQKGLQTFMGQSALLAAALAVVCLLVGQLSLPLFLKLLRAPGELAPIATLYTRIIMVGLPSVMFYNYCSSALRAVGDSKTPLVAMAAASITNIVLDLLAVFVLNWGVAGAAAATVFSQLLAGCICLLKILRTPLLRFSKEDLRPKQKAIRNLMGIGTPSAAKNLVIALGGMAVTSVVNGFGTAFIAGFTATNKLYGLLEIAALSYGYAITTYVGQNYGAGRFDRIKAGMKSATLLALATAVVIAALMFLLGRPITLLFISSEDPALVTQAANTAYRYLCVMAGCLPVLYMLYLYLSALQGLGDTVRPMNAGILELVLRICIALLVGYTGYANGIFGAEAAAWIGSAAYLLYHYKKRIRREY